MKYSPLNLNQERSHWGSNVTEGFKGDVSQYSHYSAYKGTGCAKTYKPMKEETYNPLKKDCLYYDPSIKVRQLQDRGKHIPIPTQVKNDNCWHQIFVKFEIRNDADNLLVRFIRFGVLRGLTSKVLDLKGTILSSIKTFKRFWEK